MSVNHLKLLKTRVRINGYAYLCLLMLTVCLYLAYVTHDSKDFIIAEDNQLSLESFSKSIKNFEKRRKNDTEEVSKEAKMVLIVTLWRSGSSWLGQLLSRTPKAFYLYEPIHMLIKDSKRDLGLDIPESEKLSAIKQLLHCGFTTTFLKDYKNWTEIYPKMVCYERPNKTCPKLNASNITDECRSASYRIIKTVRLNLESVEEMFTLPSFKNLKVIFLARDPRGTMKSINNISKERKIWNLTSMEICTRLRNNMLMYRTLKSLYPDQLHFVRYEDIAVEPIGKAYDLWRFLEGSRPRFLPDEWISFLKESQASKNYTNAKSNPFDVNKRSTKNWQLWREEISEDVFVDTQNNCRDIITALGYRYFDSLSELRNVTSVSVLLNNNCVRVPCL